MASKKRGSSRKPSKNLNPSLPTFKQPMLLEEAQKELARQIEQGEAILAEQPSSLDEMKATTQAHWNRWESANINTLCAITDDQRLQEIYERDDVPFAGMASQELELKAELQALHSGVRSRLNRLRQILAELPKHLRT